MIRIKVGKKQGSYVSFESRGHADYAEEGSDIVCSAVSALIITTFNSLEKLTKEPCKPKDREGLVTATFTQPNSAEGRLRMDSLLLGLTEIEKEYPKYLKVMIREV